MYADCKKSDNQAWYQMRTILAAALPNCAKLWRLGV